MIATSPCPAMTVDEKRAFLLDAFDAMHPLLQVMFYQDGGRTEVEDLYSETRLRLLETADQFTPNRDAKSWIYSFARLVLCEHRYRMEHHATIFFGGSEEEESTYVEAAGRYQIPHRGDLSPAEDRQEPFSTAIRKESHEILWSCVREIAEGPEGFRTAFALDLAGLSHYFIARYMDLSMRRLRRRIRHGRLQLVEIVSRFRTNDLHPVVNEAVRVERHRLARDKLEATRPAWEWIWCQPDLAATAARLRLFGLLPWRLIRRFGLPTNMARDRLLDFEAQLRKAGWASSRAFVFKDLGTFNDP